MVQQLSTNTYGTAKWIVSSTLSNGTHSTIAAALTSASSGDTIFIRTGTYTENLTLKAGVNLAAFDCDALTPNVTIVGKATFTAAGTVSISGIRLQTNSDFFLAVTGSAASIVNLNNCYLNCSNNTGISFTSSSGSSSISIYNSILALGTTGIAYWVSTGAGGISCTSCVFANAGNSTTASSNSAGSVTLFQCNYGGSLSTSSSGICNIYNSYLVGATNTNVLTTAGTGVNAIQNSALYSGSASTISVGSGTTILLANSGIDSTNTNAITGSGTLNYANISFTNTSKTINPTTQSCVNSASFTPVLKFGGGTTGITYSTQVGRYIRNGNCITFAIALTLTSKGSSTGVATITGLPFTSANDGNTYDFPTTFLSITAATATYFFSDMAAASSTLSLFFGVATTGGFTQLADTNFANGTVCRIQGSYFL